MIKTHLERQFLEWGAALVGDAKWTNYKTQSGFVVVKDFASDYTKLLSRAFVSYVSAIQNARINLRCAGRCNWKDLEVAAFEFVGLFNSGRYRHPWTGDFLDPAAPEYRRLHEAQIYHDTTPYMWERLFEEEIRAGSWRQKAIVEAKEKLALAGAEPAQELLTRAKKLERLLKAKGYSVRDLAREARVDFHTANDWVNGRTSPYNSTLKKLADALGIAVTDLPD